MTSSDKTNSNASASSSSVSNSSSSTTATSKYSTTDRNCKTVPIPPSHCLDIDAIYSNPNDPDDKPNLDILKQHLLLEGRLTEQAALRIIETGKFFVSSLLSNIFQEKKKNVNTHYSLVCFSSIFVRSI